MTSIKLTVAVPVYNRADCIGRCIESVLNQDHMPFELLLVDDGSTDNTREVIRRYAAKSTLISVFEAPRNGGENYARNRCVEHAKGNFILWLDSDDFLVDGAVKNVLYSMQEAPGFEHYMFLPSDRANEFSKDDAFSAASKVTTYQDWVTGKVSGDFVHVMRKDVFEGLPFFEEIRGFPGINFIRIHRKTQKQLYVNKLITVRDRNRTDALSLTGHLDNKRSIWEQYLNTNYFLDYFEDDLARYDRKCLIRTVNKNLILGIAVDQVEKNKEVIDRLRKKRIGSFPLAVLNKKLMSPVLYRVIKYYVINKKHFRSILRSTT
jgi:glycosyltransferase involved in cell wall biosynthesis